MSVIAEYRYALSTGDEELIEEARRDMRAEAWLEEYFDRCDREDECEFDEPDESDEDDECEEEK